MSGSLMVMNGLLYKNLPYNSLRPIFVNVVRDAEFISRIEAGGGRVMSSRRNNSNSF